MIAVVEDSSETESGIEILPEVTRGYQRLPEAVSRNAAPK
jgi:hypothetical protein